MDQDRQIAGICGQLEVFEALIVHLLRKDAHKSSFEAEALEKMLESLQQQFPPENEFDQQWQKSKADTVTRIRAHLKISDIIRDFAKGSSAGEA